MATVDIRYDCYAVHRETVPWDDIALYSRWLACSSTITVRYLPERVMRQFGYRQTIPRHPFVFAPILMTLRQIDEAFADFEHHMVPEEAQATRPEVDWSRADEYITWYFTVSPLHYPHYIGIIAQISFSKDIADSSVSIGPNT
ncbi:uncharacterized protein LOC131658223 [Vicia villosa]|uniref:uncharacterized protein LOC131658223 n=1 Tax=Vicia villosa TaxID=3911 RepID=UPI00273B1189|nr:uncharacterized protein LOC131658223 [Vicia villosa]